MLAFLPHRSMDRTGQGQGAESMSWLHAMGSHPEWEANACKIQKKSLSVPTILKFMTNFANLPSHLRVE